jgi:YegS/Rv2252/BmrU family lipid kinase
MIDLLVNPRAGGGRALRLARQLEGALTAAGRAFTTHVSTAPGDLERIASGLPASSSAVVAVGGDGTVSEVVGGLVRGNSSRAFCVAPGGSGNDFAKALGWVRLEDTVRALELNQPERIDLVCVNGRVAAYGLGMGFDALVAADAQAHAPAWLRGLPRYLYAIMRVLPGLETPFLTLEADGAQVYAGRSVLAAAMNTPTAGGGFRLAPDASPTNGLLEIMVGGDLTRLQTLLILPRVIAGTHVTDPKVQVFRARHARFTWARPTHAHADGEQVTPATVYDVRALPAALTVLRPRASSVGGAR